MARRHPLVDRALRSDFEACEGVEDRVDLLRGDEDVQIDVDRPSGLRHVPERERAAEGVRDPGDVEVLVHAEGEVDQAHRSASPAASITASLIVG